MGRGLGAQGIIIMAVQVDVGVNQPRQHQLALGVNYTVGGGQELLRRHRHDFLPLNSHGGVQSLGRSYHLAAAYNSVHPWLGHAPPPRFASCR